MEFLLTALYYFFIMDTLKKIKGKGFGIHLLVGSFTNFVQNVHDNMTQ